MSTVSDLSIEDVDAFNRNVRRLIQFDVDLLKARLIQICLLTALIGVIIGFGFGVVFCAIFSSK